MLHIGAKAPQFEGADRGTLCIAYVIDEQGISVDAIGKRNTKEHTKQILK